MLSINAMATMAAAGTGAVAGGFLGFRHARNDDSMDLADRVGFTSSSAIAGTVGGVMLQSYGIRRVGNTAALSISGMTSISKGLIANPGRSAFRAMGRKKFGFGSLPKPARSAMGLLALTAATVGLVAYGASTSDPKSTTDAYPDGAGGASYGSSVKERMGLLGATGDMVFGLNNLRHG